MMRPILTLLILSVCSAAQAGVSGDLTKGSRLYKDQKYGQALTSYQRALAKDPYSQVALFNIGAAHYRLKEYHNAENAWRNAAEKPGERAQDAQFNLGNAFYRGNDLDKAISAYRKAIVMNPKDKEAVHNLQIALEKKQNQQQNQDNPNQGGGGQNDQNKGQSGGSGQDQRQPNGGEEQEKQERQASSQMKKEEADRVTQMAKENEYRRPAQKNQSEADTPSVEKDW